MYTKDDLASALGINIRMVNDRIHKLDDPPLLDLYHQHKYFSYTQYLHTINCLHGYLGHNCLYKSGNELGGGKF